MSTESLIAWGIGTVGALLIIAGGFGLAAHNGGISTNDPRNYYAKYDERTKKWLYGNKDDDTFAAYALPMTIVFTILGIAAWWVLSGNFTNSVRMPWG